MMNRKMVTLFILFFVIGWLFYFKFGIKNLYLLFDFKHPTPVTPLYYVKAARERIQSFFILGNRDTADWNFNLAQKRIVESQILCHNGMLELGRRQLLLAHRYYDKGVSSLNYLIDVIDTNYLIQEKKNIENLFELTCK